MLYMYVACSSHINVAGPTSVKSVVLSRVLTEFITVSLSTLFSHVLSFSSPKPHFILEQTLRVLSRHDRTNRKQICSSFSSGLKGQNNERTNSCMRQHLYRVRGHRVHRTNVYLRPHVSSISLRWWGITCKTWDTDRREEPGSNSFATKYRKLISLRCSFLHQFWASLTTQIPYLTVHLATQAATPKRQSHFLQCRSTHEKTRIRTRWMSRNSFP